MVGALPVGLAPISTECCIDDFAGPLVMLAF